MEISSPLILYVLLWINIGGLTTGTILFVEFCFLLIGVVILIDGIVDLITFGASLNNVDSIAQPNNLTMCILVYYSMLHSVDNNNYILDENVRNKSNQLMIKYGLNKIVHAFKTW